MIDCVAGPGKVARGVLDESGGLGGVVVTGRLFRSGASSPAGGIAPGRIGETPGVQPLPWSLTAPAPTVGWPRLTPDSGVGAGAGVVLTAPVGSGRGVAGTPAGVLALLSGLCVAAEDCSILALFACSRTPVDREVEGASCELTPSFANSDAGSREPP